MDDFTSALRAQVQGATGKNNKWGDVNPLVVIGLTESILGLGLTEDQIHAVIRSYGRQLAAQIHPDRPDIQSKSMSEDRQREILDAFNTLDDSAVFQRALAEFRNLRAADRRETHILSQALHSLRAQVASSEAQSRTLRESREAFEAEKREFEKQKKEEPLLIPTLQEEIASLYRKDKDREEDIKAAKQSTVNWTRRFDSLATYLSELGSSGHGRPGLMAAEANWVAVVSLFRPPTVAPTPTADDGTVRPEFRTAALLAGMSTEAVEILLTKWRDASTQMGSPDWSESRRLPLCLTILGLRAGKPTKLFFGDRTVALGGRIIGSTPPEKVSAGRRLLASAVAQDTILATLSPYLLPGGLLVSIQQDTGKNKAKWSLLCPAFRTTTKRILLMAG